MENRKLNLFKMYNTSYKGYNVDERVYRALRERIRGYEVLDVGCGPGRLLQNLTPYNHSVGIDFSRLSIIRARENNNPKADFVLMDGEYLAFKEDSFDTSVVNMVLENKSYQRKIPEEMWR